MEVEDAKERRRGSEKEKTEKRERLYGKASGNGAEEEAGNGKGRRKQKRRLERLNERRFGLLPGVMV